MKAYQPVQGQGLPQEQVDNLCYARKVPLIYGRAALSNWVAWDAAKVSTDGVMPGISCTTTTTGAFLLLTG